MDEQLSLIQHERDSLIDWFNRVVKEAQDIRDLQWGRKQLDAILMELIRLGFEPDQFYAAETWIKSGDWRFKKQSKLDVIDFYPKPEDLQRLGVRTIDQHTHRTKVQQAYSSGRQEERNAWLTKGGESLRKLSGVNSELHAQQIKQELNHRDEVTKLEATIEKLQQERDRLQPYAVAEFNDRFRRDGFHGSKWKLSNDVLHLSENDQLVLIELVTSYDSFSPNDIVRDVGSIYHLHRTWFFEIVWIERAILSFDNNPRPEKRFDPMLSIMSDTEYAIQTEIAVNGAGLRDTA